MAAALVPSKLVLKGTSTMSLNDRFTKLGAQQAAAVQPQVRLDTSSIMRADNQRLLQMMEQRPNVRAALSMATREDRRGPKRITQRLGVKARLGIPQNSQLQQRFNGFGPQRRGFRQPFSNFGGRFLNQYRTPGFYRFKRYGGYANYRTPLRQNNQFPTRRQFNYYRGVGSGRGRGGGRMSRQFGNRRSQTSAEQLDNELDAYMNEMPRQAMDLLA